MDLHEIFALGTAKFPPDQMPALIEEMKSAQEKVNADTTTSIQNAFGATLTAGQLVATQLATGAQFDIVLVDRDLDNTAYGIIDSLRGTQKAFHQWEVALDGEQKQSYEDAFQLQRSLFAFSLEQKTKEENVFNLPFLAEWSAVATILKRSNTAENAGRIGRLHLGSYFRRLIQCHKLLGNLLGINTAVETPTTETSFESFTQEMQKLIGAVISQYPHNTDEHQSKRSLILGPYQRHIEAYRERTRRRRDAKAAKAEPQVTPIDPAASE